MDCNYMPYKKDVFIHCSGTNHHTYSHKNGYRLGTSTRRSTQLILEVKRFLSGTMKRKQKIQTLNSRSEVDSYADTCVAGVNCYISSYTGKECNVAPYSDNCKPILNIPIVIVATACNRDAQDRSISLSWRRQCRWGI